MDSYQLVLVLSPDLSSEGQKKLLEKIKTQIKNGDGIVKKEENLGKKALSYPIRKKTEGFYYVVNFNIKRKEVEKIKEKVKTETDILRYLLIGIKDRKERKKIN